MKRLVTIGDNCIDFYDVSGEMFPGGNPVNVAVYTRRMGAEAAYIGAVGNDMQGRFMLEAMRRKDIDVSRVKIIPGSTALTHVSIVEGNRVFGDYDEGVMADFKLDESDLRFISDFDMAASGLWGKIEGDFVKIRALGVMTAFDCSDRPDDPAAQTALPNTDIAFFSDDFSDDAELKAKLAHIAALGPRIVVATRGARGSLAFDGERYTHFGVPDVAIRDTMGAGDSFIAGFLNAYLSGKPIKDCMAEGTRQSGITLGYSGAW